MCNIISEIQLFRLKKRNAIFEIFFFFWGYDFDQDWFEYLSLSFWSLIMRRDGPTKRKASNI